MRERIVIVFIAIAIGLIVTTLVFFLYQQTKTIPLKPAITRDGLPKPTPENSVALSIDEPKDESLSDRRSIQVKGRTSPENTVVVSTNQEDIVAKPTTDGKFSITITIDSGSNKIVTRAIAPNGEEKEDIRIVTFNTEDF